MVNTATQRREWPLPAQITLVVLAAASAVPLITGFFIALPISTGLLIVGILAKPELGRFRIWVIVLAALGILLAVGWLLLALDISGLVDGGINQPSVGVGIPED
ncbi:hypothetical protein ACFQ58_05540 [Agromyces sp. NPDC056523]|uniref:hypothetical protein n=1 Tax=Agromyces sp. NPDC056523 TaxID=3345850 RepID=UPI00366D9EF4